MFGFLINAEVSKELSAADWIIRVICSFLALHKTEFGYVASLDFPHDGDG